MSVPSIAIIISSSLQNREMKKKTHIIGETLVLPTPIDMVEIMFAETCAKQLRQIPLADNTVGRRISDMQVDEPTDVA